MNATNDKLTRPTLIERASTVQICRCKRHGGFLFRVAVLLLIGLVVSASTSLAEQKFGYLSDDGEVVTVGKVPEALKLASFANHLGVVKHGTLVEILESRADPVIPAKWTRVKILDGQYRGQTGWALSQTVHEVKPNSPEQKRAIAASRNAARMTGRSRNEKPPKDATHQVVEDTPVFSGPSEQSVDGARIKEGVWVQQVQAARQGQTSIRFPEAKVLSGERQGAVVWIPTHTLRNVRIRFTVIANPSDRNSWSTATALAKRSDVERIALQRLDPLQDEYPDLADREEVVLLDHGGEDETWTDVILTGDNPASLAQRFERVNVTARNQKQTVELMVCTAGQWKKRNGRKYNFAVELAKVMGKPIVAYPHYVRVTYRGSPFGLLSADVKGYRYTKMVAPDMFEAEYFSPPERTQYSPNGASTRLPHAYPNVIKRHARK